MKGFFNRLLRINLSKKCFSYEEIPDAVLRKTLGGKGLGAHLLMQENPQGIDPLSPENVFIIVTGPATGTKMWSQSRFGVFAKSPATGGYGESYCGGSLAPKIKGCGVDAIILEGKCETLSFLAIDEQGVTFHDAAMLRGKDTAETETYLLEHSPQGAGAMTIGPAGEQLVRFACIKAEYWRSLGRGGMGAVMGAKHVKGMTFAGTQKCDIADETLLKDLIKAIAQKSKDMPVTENYRKYGTPMQVAVANTFKCFPTRYWQAGSFEKWENLSGEYMQENFDVSNNPCPNCFLQCTKKSRIRHGRHTGLELDGPEFETIYALGGLNEVDTLEEVAYLNTVCDRLGVDTMSAGNITAFAIEAYKRRKTDFAIDYNQPDRMVELLHLIVKREGIGAIFARGIKEAARELDLEDLAVHVKGLEPAGYEPRTLKGMGLSYATSARGACHLRGTFYKAELSRQMDPDQIQGKAELMVDYEDRAAIFDCMVLCRFFRDFILWDELLQLTEALTGLRFTQHELQLLANRITQQTREYNLREGLDASTDTLPPFIVNNPTREGNTLPLPDLETMVKEYNSVRTRRDRELQAM